MSTEADKPLAEEKTNSSADDEGEGDNPGVGGMPAGKPRTEEKTNSGTDHGGEGEKGDNPGVGGMPAEKSLSDEDGTDEPRR